MSLINDALKKAQRARGETSDYMPSTSGDGSAARKRGTAMPAQIIVLIVVGCLLLVATSIGITVWLVGGKNAAPVVAAAKVEPPALKAVTTPSPAAAPVIATSTPEKPPTPIEISLPKFVPSEPAVAPVNERPPAERPPVKTNPKTAAVTRAPVIETAKEPAAAGPKTSGLALPDERVNAFLDTLRVTGIRSSGTDSRVLMNDKVYRVNDIVDRTFGLRLTKVATDTLTFTDANGVVYEKNF